VYLYEHLNHVGFGINDSFPQRSRKTGQGRPSEEPEARQISNGANAPQQHNTVPLLPERLAMRTTTCNSSSMPSPLIPLVLQTDQPQLSVQIAPRVSHLRRMFTLLNGAARPRRLQKQLGPILLQLQLRIAPLLCGSLANLQTGTAVGVLSMSKVL
jgi:hypothetical protein